MNCIDVCRQIASNPEQLNEAIQVHLQNCNSCSAYARSQQQFEKSIDTAIRVNVPEGLAAKILLKQANLRSKAIFRPQQTWLAVAASLLLVVGLAWKTDIFISEPSIEQSVLAHVNNEIYHLSNKKEINLKQLNAMVGTFKVKFNKRPDSLNYAGTCRIHKYKGVHLVLQGKAGPVTILVMPKEYVAARSILSDKRFKGLIVPVKNGSMAIVGEANEDLDQVERRIRSMLNISI